MLEPASNSDWLAAKSLKLNIEFFISKERLCIYWDMGEGGDGVEECVCVCGGGCQLNAILTLLRNLGPPPQS